MYDKTISQGRGIFIIVLICFVFLHEKFNYRLTNNIIEYGKSKRLRF